VTRKRLPRPEPAHDDLFTHAELYPVRAPQDSLRPVDLSLRVKTAMGRALAECPDSAAVVAARMSELTGRTITTDALYAYTAPSKPDHDISIVRFIAFVRATGATWLWDLLVHDDGLVVMEGREAHLAQLGLMRQQQRQLGEAIRSIERDLQQRPVKVATCRRSAPFVRGER